MQSRDCPPHLMKATTGDTSDVATSAALKAGEEKRLQGITDSVSQCIVSFTGFREDDEWPHADDDDDASESGGRRSERVVYEQMAHDAGVIVQPTLMSSTHLLVARRGFTQKRLLATHRRVPVVLPRWLEDGCPRSSTAAATRSPADADSTLLVSDEYAVPWLHGYVFSTTGLTTEEKAAIQHICAQPQHAAVVEAALTYRCDALLTSAECVRGLSELLRRDAAGVLNKNNGASSNTRSLREGNNAVKCVKRGKDVEKSRDALEGVAGWLTDKLRFALDFDIPVVDYVRLFSLLRLEQLPPPSCGLTSARAPSVPLQHLKSAERSENAEWTLAEETALAGADFDAVVQRCRVGAPQGGPSRWRHVLSVAAAPMLHTNGDFDHSAAEGAASPVETAEAWPERRSASSASQTSTSSAASSSAAASTVSDPDAWEDFMQHALLPDCMVNDAGAMSESGHPQQLQQQQQQRIDAYPAVEDNGLPLNTADVDVQATAADELATMHVSTADYYSAGNTFPTAATDVLGGATCTAVTADSFHDSYAGIEMSPRLTTNATQRQRHAPFLAAAKYSSKEDDENNEVWHSLPSPSPTVTTTTAAVAAEREGGGSDHSTAFTAATTQVLVESCPVGPQSADAADMFSGDAPLTKPRASNHNDHAQLQQLPQRVARVTLPLWCLHPPYLSVCLVGCTEAEAEQAAVWCAVARFLRSPCPTITTDVVVLGSAVLTRKKYVVPSAQDASVPHMKKRRQTSLRSAAAELAKQGPAHSHTATQHAKKELNKLDSVVTVRYWELDAVVAHVLAETCGIGADRIAPLRWLEDVAAASARKEAADAALTSPSRHSTNGEMNMATSASPPRAGIEMTAAETATTAPDTLADVIQERLCALQVKSSAAATSNTAAPFVPLPALLPEELPSLADTVYYIRLRRSHTAAAPSAKPTVASKVPDALVLQRQQQDLTVMDQLVDTPFSPASSSSSRTSSAVVPLSKQASLTTAGTSRVPFEQGGALNGTAATPSSSCVATPRPQSEASVSTTAPRATEPVQTSDDDDAELAAAGRRFHQLIALFHVEGGQSDDDDDMANVARARRQVLQSCCFCCVDGDYARTDWAVVRGLVRYGAGQVEKRTAEAWGKLLAALKTKGKNAAEVRLSASGGDKAKETDVSAEQRRLVMRVRRSMEFEKQLRNLAKLVLHSAPTSLCARATDAQSVATPVSETIPTIAAGENEEFGGDDTTGAAAHLKTKLAHNARTCQQLPTFCLLPHSFQRAVAAAAAVNSRTTTAHISSTSRGRLPLHDMARVTQDYVLACLAAGVRLHPRSCFLFHTAIPSAPDMRLFQVTPRPASWQKAKTVEDASAPQPRRPALSAWMQEKRYRKPESVGVCVSFLWRLPRTDSQWVTTVEASALAAGSSTPAVQLQATPVNAPRVCIPSVRLVPLIRVLLLGLRNAVESMGGHVVDAFSAAAVTHVVVVDVDTMLSSSLHDMYTDAVEALERDAVVKRQEGYVAPATCYWPAEAVKDVVRCAAQEDVSLLGLSWLASCVEWGTFVDEAAFAPPEDLQARILQHQQQQQRQPQQRLPPLKPRSSRHRGPQSLLSSQSIRDGSAAWAAEVRKRERASASTSPLRASITAAAAPDPRRPTAAPHTPPRPSLRVHVETTAPAAEAAPPHRPFVSAYAPDYAEGRLHTPVMRRLLPSSASNSNSNVESCTPPPRPPQLWDGRLLPYPPSRIGAPQPQQQPSPIPRGSATPQQRSTSHSNPLPAADRHRSVSGSAHRRRATLSASQHNTASQAEQRDAEAYVEHLGELFNFCSPGSTPLPTSARRGRDVVNSERTPLPAVLRGHLLQGVQRHGDAQRDSDGEHGSYPAAERRGDTEVVSGESDLRSPQPTQHSHIGESGVLSTPRRRTLRSVAAAAAAASAVRGTQTPLGSPRRRRHRAEKSQSSLNAALTQDTRRSSSCCSDTSTHARVGGLAEKEDSQGKTRHRHVEAARVVPVVLGSSGKRAMGNLRGQRSASPAPLTVEKGASPTAAPRPSTQAAAPPDVHIKVGGEETGEVWVVRTPSPNRSSSPHSAQADVLCPFSQEETTVPLPCADAAATLTAEAPAGVMAVTDATSRGDFSFLADVIPDSQANDASSVLVPASFVAATEGIDAYWNSGAGAAEEEKEEAVPVQERSVVSARARRSLDLLGGGGDEEEPRASAAYVDADGGDTQTEEVVLPGRVTVDVAQSDCSRPRLGACSAPRQSSPPPLPPPRNGSVRTTSIRTPVAVDVDAEEVKEAVSPEPARSPWAAHRPLSLSRRASLSPPPGARNELTRNPAAPATTSSPAGIKKGKQQRKPLEAAGQHPFCLYIYVLHDLPLRAQRVQRCLDALHTFAQSRHSPVTPTLAKPDAVHREHSARRRDSTPTKEEAEGCESRVRTSPTPPPPPPQDALPVCFVDRCEDADVCVTHELSLRESVLVAIARGCWVLQPAFLECVAAVLEGGGGGSRGGGTSGVEKRSRSGHLRGHEDPSSLLPLVQHPSTLSSAVVACFHRLSEMCMTYEWTVSAAMTATTTATPSSSSSSSSPLLRSLILQCRRSRQAAQTRLRHTGSRQDRGRNRAGASPHPERRAGGLASAFNGLTAVLLCGGGGPTMAATSVARMAATQRILLAGGGTVLSMVAWGVRLPTTHGGVLRCGTELGPFNVNGKCIVTSSSSGSGKENRLAMVPSLEAVATTAEGVYHDLTHLLCDAVWHHSSEKSSSSEGRHTQHQVMSRDDEEAGRSFVVLLDASLLQAAVSGKEDRDVCYVTATAQKCSTSALAARYGHDGNRDDVVAPAQEGTASSADGDSTDTACAFGDWLASLLSQPVYKDASNADDKRGRCHSPVTQHAMRAHLSACCSLTRCLRRLLDTRKKTLVAAAAAVETASTPPPQQTPLSTCAELRWSYKATDVPANAPALEEVADVLLRRYCNETDATQILKDLAPAWEASSAAASEQCVEFRASSWVGACVAAGGCAAMVAATRGATAVSEQETWVRDCAAQTLLGVLSYS